MPLVVRVLAVGAVVVFVLAFLKVSRNSNGALAPQPDSVSADSAATWNTEGRQTSRRIDVRTAAEAARDSFEASPRDLPKQIETLSASYKITGEEITDVSIGDSAFDVVESLRPEWLFIAGQPRDVRVRVDGQSVGGAEVLRNIRRAFVSHMRYAPWETGGPVIHVSLRR